MLKGTVGAVISLEFILRGLALGKEFCRVTHFGSISNISWTISH